MARRLRLEYAGACYHVINRGNYRRDVFAGRGAAKSFGQCLDEACVRFGWRVHAYVVLGNHFHLLLCTPEPNLSAGMKWLQGTWATRFNRFRREVGRPFQGRYKAFHVEPGHVLAQVAHYIHLNPLDAGLVAADRVGDYPWSSLNRFVARARPAWLVADTVLDEAGGLPDSSAGWRAYLDHLRLMAEEDPHLRKQKFAQMSEGWAIGSTAFRHHLRDKLQAQQADLPRFELLGSDPTALKQARAELWEEKLRMIAETFRIDLSRLPPEKSAPAKVLLAVALKKVASVSNRWLAERLGMGRDSSVSSLVTRFQREGGTDNAAFREFYSRFASCPLGDYPMVVLVVLLMASTGRTA